MEWYVPIDNGDVGTGSRYTSKDVECKDRMWIGRDGNSGGRVPAKFVTNPAVSSRNDDGLAFEINRLGPRSMRTRTS